MSGILRRAEEQAAAAREQKLQSEKQVALARVEHDAAAKIAAAEEKAKRDAMVFGTLLIGLGIRLKRVQRGHHAMLGRATPLA